MKTIPQRQSPPGTRFVLSSDWLRAARVLRLDERVVHREIKALAWELATLPPTLQTGLLDDISSPVDFSARNPPAGVRP